jgi:hypothetical protein
MYGCRVVYYTLCSFALSYLLYNRCCDKPILILMLLVMAILHVWYSDCTDLPVLVSKPRPRALGDSTSQATHTRQPSSAEGMLIRLSISLQCFCILYLSPKTCFCEQTLELCRLYELENVSTNIMKVNVVCNTLRTFFILKHLFMTVLGFEHGLASM